MRSDPRSCNPILVRLDGERKNAGSIVMRGGDVWWKSWGDGRYVLRNDESLSLNTLVVERLDQWRVKLLYYVYGKGTRRVLYRATLRDLQRLGSCTEHPGWGWNLSLPMPLWTLDRSGFDPGFVPTGHDLIIPVPAEVPRPAWAPDPQRKPEIRGFAESANVPTQLGLFDAAREKVA